MEEQYHFVNFPPVPFDGMLTQYTSTCNSDALPIREHAKGGSSLLFLNNGSFECAGMAD